MMKKNLYIIFLIYILLASSCGDSNGVMSSSPDIQSPIGGSGKGGSLARFAISNNRLYTINEFSIKIFDISNRQDMVFKNEEYIGFGIETLFPVQDKLFVGAQDAMYIYDIQNPDFPTYLSVYGHFLSCDPVVVQGNYAYVTLRVSECRPSQSFDALEIIDITNLQEPIQVNTYELDEPYGLGISGDLLFICEGNNGLKVLNVADPHNIKLVKQFTGINAYDVIPISNILILTGKDGIRQYDFSDPENIVQISELYASAG